MARADSRYKHLILLKQTTALEIIKRIPEP